MIVLLIKTSLIVIIVLGFYKVLIEKESFFSTNRAYLVLGLLLTFIIPFVSLPKLINNQGFVSELIEPSISQTSNLKNIKDNNGSNTLNTNPVELTTKQPITTAAEVTTESSRSLLDWLFIVYLFGVVVLAINLLAQIGNLVFKIIRSKDKIKDIDATIINSSSIKEPCSFFNYIFINPEQYDFEVYNQIIAHEKIHVKKKHSLDLLLSETAVILLWFNPLIWLFRREVEKNIEYQTDHLVIDTKSAEKDSYQMNLLKIATFSKPLTITTNYNQSLIKQRILKMNRKKSNPHSYWKYAFTLPMLFALLLLLNKPYSAFGQPEPPNLDDALIATDIESEPEYFSDCEAFKKALEDKDLEMLKEILVNLDPACTAYIENSKHATLNSVKTKLEEGGALELDTTGDVVVTDTNGTTTDAIDTVGISKEITSSNSECRPLLDAIRADDINAVRNLIKTVDVNCIDPNPGYNETKSNGNYWRYQKAKSPLFAVARTGNLEIAKLLVEKGADVKLNVQGDGTALITAAEYGHLELVKYFNSKGADISRKFPNQGNSLIAASGNGHLDVMKYLISEGVDINHYSPNQGNALIAAAHSDNVDAVKYLVEKGMDVNFLSANQGNALIVASSNGRLETVKYLISKGAKVNKISPNQGTPLIAASNNGRLDVVIFLLAQGAEVDKISPNQGTALIAASNNGRMDVVKLLVDKGADVNRASANQGSPLNAAARNGHLETLKLLIAKGADVNVQSNNQGSALNAAARNGKNDIIEVLISKGVDINAQTNGQGSALNAAARNGHLETLKLLLAKGADVNLQNNSQGSALNAAARNGKNDIIKVLIAKGVDVNAQTNGQGSALNAAARNGHLTTVKLLLEKGANVNLHNNSQGSALNAAAKNGMNSTIKLLLAKGAEINAQTNGQGSALNAAARNNHLDTVKLLLEKGADVNLHNNSQGSALNAAARNGHLDTVKLLVSKGANVNLYSNGQGTALAAASRNGYQAVVDYLLSQGAKHIYSK